MLGQCHQQFQAVLCSSLMCVRVSERQDKVRFGVFCGVLHEHELHRHDRSLRPGSSMHTGPAFTRKGRLLM